MSEETQKATGEGHNLDISVVKKERILNAEKIVIATNFLYTNYKPLVEGQSRQDGDTDGIRGDLALELLNKTLDNGVRVVACDGGSSDEFLSTLEQVKDKGLTVVKSEIPGRAPQRRKAFETAALLPNSKVIVYTQSEKVSLIDHLAEISKPILEGKADVVIPKRKPELFNQTYPKYMRQSELRVNKTYDWLMKRAGFMAKGESFDWFFGPVVFRNDPEIVDLFLRQYSIVGSIRSRIGAQTDPEKNSGNHYFPIIEALFNRKEVLSVEVPFVYPESQFKNETSPEAIERFRQRRKQDGVAYRLEAIHFLAFLRGDEKDKIKPVS